MRRNLKGKGGGKAADSAAPGGEKGEKKEGKGKDHFDPIRDWNNLFLITIPRSWKERKGGGTGKGKRGDRAYWTTTSTGVLFSHHRRGE